MGHTANQSKCGEVPLPVLMGVPLSNPDGHTPTQSQWGVPSPGQPDGSTPSQPDGVHGVPPLAG